MFKYTHAEIDELWLDLLLKNGADYEDAGLHNAPVVKAFLEIQGRLHRISRGLLDKIMEYDEIKHPDFKQNLSPEFKGVLVLAKYTDLNRVPLYINEIPEVANWRLRIGK